MSLVDLHILAATAATHLQQAQPSPAYNKQTSYTYAKLDSSATADNGCPSMLDMDLNTEGAGAGGGRSARSSDSHLRPSNPRQKNHNHRAAEAKRRERINERLQALRELVPHDQRSNTATFLEGVISYIQDLQHSNAALEAELSSHRALRAAAAASMEQAHELLAQPAASGSNAANSAQRHAVQQQQQQYYGSSWRQESTTGPPPPPHSPEAAAAAAAAAHWQHTAAGQTLYEGAADVVQALHQHLQHQQHHGAAGLHAPERSALSSSPPLPYRAAAVAPAAGPASTTLSAPASLMQSLMQQHASSAPADAGPGMVEDTATATASAAAAGIAPGSLQAPVSGGPSGVQPTELQGVLEKALLAALQQQAQQLATQLLSRGS